jgi:hypothetical protein
MDPGIIIINIINIICASIIIYYLYYLKRINCKCSLNYKRQYIIGFNIILVLYSLFFIFSKYNVGNFPILGYLITIAEVISVIFTISFVYDLKLQNCKCSVSLLRTIMYILAIITICTWIISLLFIIVTALFLTK